MQSQRNGHPIAHWRSYYFSPAYGSENQSSIRQEVVHVKDASLISGVLNQLLDPEKRIEFRKTLENEKIYD